MTLAQVEDPDFNVEQTGATLFANVALLNPDPDRQVGIQGFGFDDVHQRLYAASSYVGAQGDLWLTWYDTSRGGTRQSEYMTLKGFGHGQQVGVQIEGATTWIWLECDSVLASNGVGYGQRICRFQWVPGRTLDGHGTTNMQVFTLQPGSLGNSANLDMSQNRLVLGFQMNGLSYRAPYSVDDIVALGNAAKPLSPPIRAATFPGGMQGGVLFGDYIYATTGGGKTGGYCGTNQVHSLGWQNIWNGASGYAPNNTALSIPVREAEGIAVQTTPNGVHRLVFSFATRVDCTGAGGPRQSWFYINEQRAAPTGPQRSSSTGIGGPLGCAQEYRIMVFDRGGMDRVGEITPVQNISWGRTRDDISSAVINTAGFGPDCCDLLDSLRSMRHELVIFRDGVRVWEGPITRIAFAYDSVEIEARDVMHYLHRRIFRLGYNHSYDTVAKKSRTQPVTNTIEMVIKETLSPTPIAIPDDPHEPEEFAGGYDPNILKYLKVFKYSDDARESRLVYPFQFTTWELIDDMAANSGIDYTVTGRMIMVWDTSRWIGKTQVLTDDDFLATPIVTEYGMSLATFSAVTDGKGFYGVAGGMDHYYGMVEILASTFSESTAPDKTGVADYQKLKVLQNTYYSRKHEYERYPCLSAHEEAVLAAYYKERGTPGVKPERQKVLEARIKPLAARVTGCATLKTRMNNAYKAWKAQQKNSAKYEQQITDYVRGLSSQAARNLRGKNPAPMSVRIPENSQLNPEVMLGINDIVPGIWIPLQSRSTCRTLIQWQKLDSMQVTVSAENGVVTEQVAVSMSPAPQYGADPDAESDQDPEE